MSKQTNRLANNEIKMELDQMEVKPRKLVRQCRKPLRDVNAPKLPRNAYQIFMVDARPIIVKANPDASMLEVAKLLGLHWKEQVDETKKQEYQALAAKERATYQKIFDEYKKSDSYREFQKLKKKHEQQSSKVDQKRTSSDIAVFSESFLKYNRERETELRELRKQSGRLLDELTQLKTRSDRLETALHHLHTDADEAEALKKRCATQTKTLAGKIHPLLGNLPLPTDGRKPTPETIVDYIIEAEKIFDANSHPTFINKLKDACKKL